MKNHLGFWIGVLASFTISISYGQRKAMAMDTSLKDSAVVYQIKRKGIRSLGRYEFGPYKIVSGKSGAQFTTSESNLFGSKHISESNQSNRFIMTNALNDSVLVETMHHEKISLTDDNGFVFRELFGWHDYDVKEAYESFTAKINHRENTEPIQLIMVIPLRLDLDEEMHTDDKTTFKGIIQYAGNDIMFKPVFYWDTNRKTLLGNKIGYEFKHLGKSIAAVQVYPINRQKIWLAHILEEEDRFVLSAAITSLLIFEEAHF